MMTEINYLLSSRVTNRLRELCESRQHLTKLAESVQFLFLLGLYLFFFFICLRLSLSDPNCTSASIHDGI